MVRRFWVLGLVLGSLSLVAGALAYSAIAIAQSLARIAHFMVGAVLEQFVQSLVSAATLMILLEVVNAALLWVTQGPWIAAAWIQSRIAAWQGP